MTSLYRAVFQDVTSPNTMPKGTRRKVVLKEVIANEIIKGSMSMKKLSLSILAATLCLSTLLPLNVLAEGNSSYKQNNQNFSQRRPNFDNMTPEQQKAWQTKREERHQQMMDALGLTSEQASKIKSIREQNHNQAKSIHDQLMGKRKSLMEYMSSSNADPTKAKLMQQEVNQLQSQLSDLRMNTWFEMKKNLTPEQITKMQQLRQQHRQNMGNHGQGGPGGEQGNFGNGFGNKPSAGFQNKPGGFNNGQFNNGNRFKNNF